MCSKIINCEIPKKLQTVNYKLTSLWQRCTRSIRRRSINTAVCWSVWSCTDVIGTILRLWHIDSTAGIVSDAVTTAMDSCKRAVRSCIIQTSLIS